MAGSYDCINMDGLRKLHGELQKIPVAVLVKTHVAQRITNKKSLTQSRIYKRYTNDF